MDKEFDIVITTLLGLESFTAREIKRLGYEDIKTEDGRVTFRGDMEAVARANMWVRTGERVFIKLGEFYADTYDALFEGTKSLPWESIIDKNGAFPVKGHTLKSKLYSERDCQAIIKKAIADRLSQKYGAVRLSETGALYKVSFSLMKDIAVLMIDTSGEPLHKRGYRPRANLAPLRETIAAAMVMLSYWKFEYPLCDPFCGSGTIPIEAAMFKKNMAPGMKRCFAYEAFEGFDKSVKETVIEEAEDSIRDIPLVILASDIDSDTVMTAIENIENAGLGDIISPVVKNAKNFRSDIRYGTIITNPPYGERLGDKAECEALYGETGMMYSGLKDWSCYILAPDGDFEKFFGRRADKKRKVYNGMIKCNIYQYFGAKP